MLKYLRNPSEWERFDYVDHWLMRQFINYMLAWALAAFLLYLPGLALLLVIPAVGLTLMILGGICLLAAIGVAIGFFTLLRIEARHERMKDKIYDPRGDDLEGPDT